MHPQHMQPSSVLHLPLVTAMTGQVKVSVVNLVLRPTKFGHGGLQDVQGYIKVRMSLREVAHSYCLQQKGGTRKANTSTWEAVLSGMKARKPKQLKPAITHTDMCQHVRALKTGHMTAYSGTGYQKKGGVAHLLNCRDDCLAFWLIVPPLLIVPSLACSVASLSLCPEP